MVAVCIRYHFYAIIANSDDLNQTALMYSDMYLHFRSNIILCPLKHKGKYARIKPKQQIVSVSKSIVLPIPNKDLFILVLK